MLLSVDLCHLQITVPKLEALLAKDKETFPDNPDVWLKDLVSLIDLELENVPVGDVVFEGKSPGMCVCACVCFSV